VKVLRTTQAQGTGEPGMLLDHELTVACGEGAIRILELQRAGRQAMRAGEFLRGVPLKPPLRLD
jgi:methionyl-tRNA formyltransferase